MGDTTLAGEDSAGTPNILARGSHLDRYVLQHVLGSGSMGVVYAAYDPRLERNVALKVLHRTGRVRSDDEGVLAEARALARLNDANVVSVFDAGRIGDSVYLTMALVEGETLAGWLQAQDRTMRAIVAVLLSAGRGLAAAHEAGIVHRDFKPANVMVDRRDHAKVMDFGLAAELTGTTRESASSSPPSRRRPGAGTPLYMSPEQFMGLRASPAADQYSFCVACYEALSGGHPYGNVHTTGALLEALATPPPPLTNRKIPAALRAAILRGMHADPDERWPSMEPLLHQFEQVLKGGTSRWLVGAATVVAAGGVAAAMARDKGPVCESAQSQAAALVTPGDTETLAAGFADFDETYGSSRVPLILDTVTAYAERWGQARLAVCEARRVGAEIDPARRRTIDRCLQARRLDFQSALGVLLSAEGIERLHAADLVLGLPEPERCTQPSRPLDKVAPPEADVADDVAGVRSELARLLAQAAIGRLSSAETGAREQLLSAQQLGYTPLEAEALHAVGSVLADLHQIDEAEQMLLDAAWLALAEGDRRLALDATLGLLALRRDVSEVDATTAWADRAMRLIDAGSDPGVEVELYGGLSIAFRESGDFSSALAYGTKAYDIAKARYGDADPRSSKALHLLAAAHLRLGKMKTARQLADHALRLRQQTLGLRHPEVASSLMLMAAIERAVGDLDQAEAHLNRAVAIRRTYAPNPRLLAGVLSNLGGVYRQQKRWADARAAVLEAVEIWSALGHDDSKVYGLIALARVSLDLDEYQRARDETTQAWSLVNATRSGRHPEKSAIAGVRGRTEYAAGELEAARAWLRRGLAVEPLADSSARYLQGWLARVELALGDSPQAVVYAKAALQGRPRDLWPADELAALEAIVAGREP